MSTQGSECIIDERLLAHIHNDAFLAGSYQLEGNCFAKTISFLRQFIHQSPKLSIPIQLTELIKKFSYTTNVEQQLSDSTIELNNIKCLANRIGTDILTLPKNDYILVPGGWLSQADGHAMLYKISRENKDNIYFSIINSGDGARFHPKLSTISEEQHSAYLTYKFNQTEAILSNSVLNDLIEQLLILQVPKIHQSSEISADYIYIDLLSKLTLFNAEIVDHSDAETSLYYTKGQLSGICSQSVLHKLLKPLFGNIDEYRRFIFNYKMYALEKYIEICNANGNINKKQFQPQIKKAIKHNLRILNLTKETEPSKWLFSEREKSHHHQRLCDYLATMRPIIKNKAELVIKAEQTKSTFPYFHVSFFKAKALPKIEAYISDAEISIFEESEREIDLLSQLDATLMQCEMLNQNDRSHEVVYLIEKFLLSLPLPEHSYEEELAPSYQKLKNKYRAKAFCQKLQTLQNLYFRYSQKIFSLENIPPRMLLTKLIISSLVFHLNSHWQPKSKDYLQALSATMHGLSLGAKDTVHMSQHDPNADQYWLKIKNIFKNSDRFFNVDSTHTAIINFFDKLLQQDPEIYQECQRLYLQKYGRDLSPLHLTINKNKLGALYYYLENRNILTTSNYSAINQSFDLQFSIQTILSDFSHYLGSEYSYYEQKTPPILELNDNKQLIISCQFLKNQTDYLLTQKLISNSYTFSRPILNSIYNLSLEKVGYFINQKPSANLIQLYPATILKKMQHKGRYDLSMLSEEERSQLSQTSIDDEALIARSLLQIRQSPQTQILSTIDYYIEHSQLLTEKDYQTCLEANILQPGLLIDILQNNPDLFFERLQKLFDVAERGFEDHRSYREIIIFITRLEFLIVNYGNSLQSISICAYNKLIEKIETRRLSTSAIADKSQLYYYQFLATMEQIKRQETIDIESLLTAYLYIKIHERHLNDIKRYEFHQLQINYLYISELVKKNKITISNQKILNIIKKLDLEINLTEAVISGSLPKYTIQNDTDRIELDIESGSITRQQKLLISPPSSILDLPLLQYLGLNAIKISEFSTADQSYQFEVKNKKYTLYKYSNTIVLETSFMAHNKRLESFQLFAHSKSKASILKIPYFRIEELPEYFKDKSYTFWINQDQEEILIRNTSTDTICYRGILIKHTWQFHAFDNDGLLLDKNSWLHLFLSDFESPEFILAHQKEGEIDVFLPRYQLSLNCNLSANPPVFSFIYQNQKFILQIKNQIADHIASLHFTNGSKNIALIPIQRLLATNNRNPSNEYHQLCLDTENTVNQKIVEECKLDPRKYEWHFENSASFFLVQMKEDGYIASNPQQSLYLVYLYIGTQQYEKAIETIDYCRDQQGGIGGTPEELKILSWILKDLPYSSCTQKQKIKQLNTAEATVCKLKALALFSEYYLNHKKIAIEAIIIANPSINDILKKNEIKKLQSLQSNLIDEIYKNYIRYQKCKKSLDFNFQLQPHESRTLLSHYHQLSFFKKKLKAPIGSLGYEWLQNELPTLQKEFAALSSQKEALRIYDRNRLRYLKNYLSKYPVVYNHTSALSEVHVDTSLPTICPIRKEESYTPHYQLLTRRQSFFSYVDISLRQAQILIHKLQFDMKDELFLSVFDQCITLACSDKDFYKLKLKDFCAKIICAHSNSTHSEKINTISILCNLLYRIIDNQDAIHTLRSSKYPPENFDQLYHALSKLPDPKLSQRALLDTYEDILATADTINASAPNTAISSPIQLDKSTLSINHLAEIEKHSCYQFKLEWLALYHQYKHKNNIFASKEKNSLETNHAIDIKIGIQKFQALKQLIKLSKTILKDEILPSLQTDIEEQIHQIKQQLFIKKYMIEALLNSSGQNKETALAFDIALLSGEKRKLTIEDGMKLFALNNYQDYQYKTQLTRKVINLLHLDIGKYINASVALQQLLRMKAALENLKKISKQETKLNKFQLAKLLFSENMIDPFVEPQLALYQYQQNLLIRVEQYKTIQRLTDKDPTGKYINHVEKIIMGGGKSKVILPTVAKQKATGDNLVIIEVPSALLKTNYIDLKSVSSACFGQQPLLFEFNRNSDSQSIDLENIYKLLCRCITEQNYIVTTGESLQSIELKYIELLYKYQKKNETEPVLEQESQSQLTLLENILLLFKDKGDLLIDEVHQQLLYKDKLNYTLDTPLKLTTSTIHQVTQLYQFLGTIFLPLSSNKILTLQDILNNRELLDANKAALFEQLIHNLLNSPDSPITDIISKLSKSELTLLASYLNESAQNVPAFISKLPLEQKSLLALYKEQINRLLPHSLNRTHKVHYGSSNKAQLSIAEQTISVPYEANNKPNIHSRYGNPIETINYTIQSVLLDGIPEEIFYDYQKKLQFQCQKQKLQLAVDSYCDTPTGQFLSQLLKSNGLTLSEFMDPNVEQCFSIYKKIYKSPEFIYPILEEEILPKIEYTPSVLSSDAYCHVSMVRSCQGMSGTPINAPTFHDSLLYDPAETIGTNGFVNETIKQKLDSIISYDFEDLDNSIKALFDLYESDEPVRAIIDICAAFKGISNFDIAHAIVKYLQTHPDKFNVGKSIKHVLYFNDDNKLCALPISYQNNQDIILLGSSDPKIIQERLGCSAEERFTVYDQSHAVGTDITQLSAAKALVMIDKKTPLSSFYQGCMRMRSLSEGEQTLDLVVPNSLADNSFKQMISMMKDNEFNQIKSDNYHATRDKLANVLRTEILQLIYTISQDAPDAVQTKQAILQAFEVFFIEKQSSNLFEQYGDCISIENTQTLLHQYKLSLYHKFKAIKQSLTIDLPDPSDHLLDRMNMIIHNTVSSLNFHRKETSRIHNMGYQVEVENEIEVEYEVEKINRQYQASLVAKSYVKWVRNARLKVPKTLSLNDVITESLKNRHELSAAPIYQPTFSQNIRVSENFYQSYQTQTDFLDSYSKAVHSLLFFYEGKELICQLITQQECQELLKHPHLLKEGSWVSNSYGTQLYPQSKTVSPNDLEYLSLLEQIQFFNGDINCLLQNYHPTDWLYNETHQKIQFYLEYLAHIRPTSIESIYQLQQHIDTLKNITQQELTETQFSALFSAHWMTETLIEIIIENLKAPISQTIIDFIVAHPKSSAQALVKLYVKQPSVAVLDLLIQRNDTAALQTLGTLPYLTISQSDQFSQLASASLEIIASHSQQAVVIKRILDHSNTTESVRSKLSNNLFSRFVAIRLQRHLPDDEQKSLINIINYPGLKLSDLSNIAISHKLSAKAIHAVIDRLYKHLAPDFSEIDDVLINLINNQSLTAFQLKRLIAITHSPMVLWKVYQHPKVTTALCDKITDHPNCSTALFLRASTHHLSNSLYGLFYAHEEMTGTTPFSTPPNSPIITTTEDLFDEFETDADADADSKPYI